MKVKAATLVEDFDVYPRSGVDSQHIADLEEKIRNGATLPPVIAEKKSKIIVDGFHTRRAYLRTDPEIEIEVEFREYANRQELYLDAIRLNSKHGKAIVGSEMTHAIVRAHELHVSDELTAKALGISSDRVTKIMASRVLPITSASKLAGVARVEGQQRYVILKQSLHHLAKNPRTLTKREAKAAETASGTTQWLLIRQVRELIENDFVDLGSERVREELNRLMIVLRKFKIPAAKTA